MRDVPVLALPDIILATITQRVVVARRGAAGEAAGAMFLIKIIVLQARTSIGLMHIFLVE